MGYCSRIRDEALCFTRSRLLPPALSTASSGLVYIRVSHVGACMYSRTLRNMCGRANAAPRSAAEKAPDVLSPRSSTWVAWPWCCAVGGRRRRRCRSRVK